ncbi:DUF2382 domain-containing protein [Rubrobacter marinus]|uniref:DUF2382 domain-containing protein n=1 Tax=Rubrobacter marinus TaxID=2653852 RepID=A0A6G8PZ92_9ACTN|nr:DUF2382 domain-containing protein [Rubrobacter marinus]QIN79533.1 DUF2382 domain-containing protein [Rubrobacter marinus]
MEREERTDRFTAVEDRFAGYTVYDRDGDKVGKVDDLFLDESDRPEYVGVKMGFFGLSSTLIPMDAVRVDEGSQALYVQAEKEQVKNGPRFDDDSEITPDYERQVREYYGLGASQQQEGQGSYGAYESGAAGTGGGIAMGDREGGEFREHGRGEEGVREGQADLEDEDEIRVQRSEEELRAGVREREAGQVNVRKRVRTERERIAVPKKREEVTVDRVPVDRDASPGEIGEDEVSVPVVEEEVVVEKRPVVKEEVRVRKDVVQDEEVVEEDVRKEEVDVEDASRTSGRRDDRGV